MSSNSLSELGDRFVFYCSHWLVEIEHPYGAGSSVRLLDIADRLPRLVAEFLLAPVEESRIVAAGTNLLTAFGRYVDTSRSESAQLVSAVREAASAFEPFLKKLAFFRFPGDKTWHQGIPEILFRLYPASHEFRDNCNKPDAAFWQSRPTEEAVLREAIKERHRASHEAWSMPLPNLERVVQCVLGGMLLVCRIPENYRVMENVLQAARLTRLEMLSPGELFETVERAVRRFDEYAGLGLALDSVKEQDFIGGQVTKPVFAPTVKAAVQNRDKLHRFGVSDVRRAGYRQEVAEPLRKLMNLTDEWEAYFNPKISWHDSADLNGDGEVEFIAVLSFPRSQEYSVPGSTNILCVCEQGEAHYVPVLVRILDEFFHKVDIIDANSDGIVEIATTCFAGAHSMTVHIFQWNGESYLELLPHGSDGVPEEWGFFSDAPWIAIREGEVVVRHRDYGSGRPWELSFEDTYRWDGDKYVRVDRRHFGP